MVQVRPWILAASLLALITASLHARLHFRPLPPRATRSKLRPLPVFLFVLVVNQIIRQILLLLLMSEKHAEGLVEDAVIRLALVSSVHQARWPDCGIPGGE